jgi:hypothetical protein
MRSGIAVVALPRLDEKSLSRASGLFALAGATAHKPVWRNDLPELRPGDHE